MRFLFPSEILLIMGDAPLADEVEDPCLVDRFCFMLVSCIFLQYPFFTFGFVVECQTPIPSPENLIFLAQFDVDFNF